MSTDHSVKVLVLVRLDVSPTRFQSEKGLLSRLLCPLCSLRGLCSADVLDGTYIAESALEREHMWEGRLSENFGLR